MKCPALLLALIFCCSFASKTVAQQKNRYRPQQAAEKSFAVGIAPLSLLLPSGKVNLRTEWAYAGNKSLSLLAYVPRPTAVPGLVANRLDLNGEATATTNRFMSFGAVLEHRFYLGQKALRGLYLAPYSRYNNFSITRTTQNAGSEYKTTVKGSVGGFGLGAAAGVQMRLGDFLTLDATLVGVDFKWLRGRLSYSTDDPENDLAAFRDKVEDAVGDIPIIGPKLTAAIEGNAVKVRTQGLLMPAYRFNLTVNYIF